MSGLRDITIKAGQDFSIHVPYRGFPRPTAAWTRDDVAVDDSDSRVHTQLGDDFASFVMTNAQRGDTGPYRLHLKNTSGMDTAICNVKVSQGLQSQKSWTFVDPKMKLTDGLVSRL